MCTASNSSGALAKYHFIKSVLWTYIVPILMMWDENGIWVTNLNKYHLNTIPYRCSSQKESNVIYPSFVMRYLPSQQCSILNMIILRVLTLINISHERIVLFDDNIIVYTQHMLSVRPKCLSCTYVFVNTPSNSDSGTSWL